MRLDKYLSQSSGLSRSKAQGVIRSGQITVNGEVIKDPANKLNSAAMIQWRGRQLQLGKKRYIMLHKPTGVICANSDATHKTVLDLLELSNKRGLHVAGRLDLDATGLVLITDDGDWSHRITSPRHSCGKAYSVTLAEPIDETVISVFAEGILLHNEKNKTLPAQLELLGPDRARVILSEGRYHQVKRMFAAVGNHVLSLHRERIGELELDPALSPGQWRELQDEEIHAVAQGTACD